MGGCRGGGGGGGALNLSIPSLRLNIAYIMIPVGGVKVLNIPALNVACIMDSSFLGVHSGCEVVRTVTRFTTLWHNELPTSQVQ